MNKIILFGILALLILVGCNNPESFTYHQDSSVKVLPLPMNPGAIDPRVNQSNIDETICVSGYTKTVRPPTSYTNTIKKIEMISYGYQGLNMSDFEEDHIVPLEVGGEPRDIRNLFPEPWEGEYNARDKDRLENKLHALVCSRDITLTDAQQCIARNWIDCYKHYIGESN